MSCGWRGRQGSDERARKEGSSSEWAVADVCLDNLGLSGPLDE